MFTIYTAEINTNTLEVKEHAGEIDDISPLEEEYEYALYNEDGFERVYAESLVSAERARELVSSKCVELCVRFQRCAEKLTFMWEN